MISYSRDEETFQAVLKKSLIGFCVIMADLFVDLSMWLLNVGCFPIRLVFE